MVDLPDKHRLLRNMNSCIDQEERYLYLIELGAKLTPTGNALHQAKNLVAGCQSLVWIEMHLQADGSVDIEGDSDAALVKGLIAVVIILYRGLSAQEIFQFDTASWFEKLALTRHLTASRTQGLAAMIKTIRARSLALTL